MTLLNLLDAAWLYVDSHETPMHVASLQIFSPPDGAPGDYVGRLVAEFKNARRLSPPFNRKLAGGWFSSLVYAWTIDDDVDLDYHVRHSALPRPGGERELGVLVSRLHGHPLDLTRPLWECHFIEGLEGGRFAVYFKMHHSMIDGVSGMRLLQRKLTTDPGERGMPPPWAGEEAPAGDVDHVRPAETLPRGLVTMGDLLREQAGSVTDVGMALLELLRAGVLGGDDALVAPLTCPTAVINGRITAQRRFATQTLQLDEVKTVAKAADCTVNDVLLAVCSTALRRFLDESGALPADPLTAGLPVSVRPAGDTETGTAITFICANLATNVADPRARLSAITASTLRAKAHLQGLPRAALTQYTIAVMAPYIAQILTGLGGRLRPVFNLTISNVMGPDRPLYLNGARLEAMYPMSLLSHGQALNITCLSYDGRLHFGITGCRDTLPHMQRLAVYAGEAFTELTRVFHADRRKARSVAPSAVSRRARSRVTTRAGAQENDRAAAPAQHRRSRADAAGRGR
jgi:WS/DGAT/MGAT family acyltransferase